MVIGTFQVHSEFDGYNQRTDRVDCIMPDMDSNIYIVPSSCCFALLTLCNGYTRNCSSLRNPRSVNISDTPEAVYTPKRLLYGERNYEAFLMISVPELCKETHKESLLRWVDDILVYAKSPTDFVSNVREFSKFFESEVFS